MTIHKRPLSPHLQIYRLPITGIISISHRISGVFLSAGLLFFVYMLLAIATGEQNFLAMQSLMSLWIIKLLSLGLIFSLFLHLTHGIRHLIWDIGKTLEKATLDKYALFELLTAVALSLLTFLFV